LGLSLLSLTALLGGCSAQEKIASGDTSSLVAGPVTDRRLVVEDFAFPSQTPSLMQGRELYQAQCMQCHAQGFWQTPKVKQDLAYTTPIDLYLMLTTGTAPSVVMPTAERRQVLPLRHPPFREKINRDGRWAVLFYARYLAGAGDIKSPDPKADLAAIFGGNCAVCHGPKGQGDGPLYTGKTGNHELGNAAQTNNLNPAPANFQEYRRIYNRTDAQLFKYLCEGIYPSAMPAWYGDVNVDKDTGKITYRFDEKLLTNMVRYVRTWAYRNDLSSDLPEAKTPPPGLEMLNACRPMPTNHPWTNAMRASGLPPRPPLPLQNPVTGGMILRSHSLSEALGSETPVSEPPASTAPAVSAPLPATGGAPARKAPKEGTATP
jgi:mono/diheme cytochrome c family protein